jgi:ribosomal-protein-alanine N-acetyltransferase
MTVVRRGEPADLAAIRAIQAASPESAQWAVTDYLQYDLFVATQGVRIAGFLAARPLAAGECEILNLAVAPEYRRQGVARALLAAFFESFSGAIYLEVRASNRAARSLYKSLGFEEVTARPGYYQDPSEAAIVMKFHSC